MSAHLALKSKRIRPCGACLGFVGLHGDLHGLHREPKRIRATAESAAGASQPAANAAESDKAASAAPAPTQARRSRSN